MAILIVIVVLSLLVMVHELGHFVAARLVGITVEEFGIGYPPKALSLNKVFRKLGLTKLIRRLGFTRKSKTEFSLNWIPFGGFVKMAGETPDFAGQTEHKPGEFLAASLPKRLFVIFAGVFCNFLLGIIAFTIVFSTTGIPQEIPGARIGYVEPNSPAATAGVVENVAIRAFELDGERVSAQSIQEVKSYIETHRGQTVSMITTGICADLECSNETEQSFLVYLRTEAETPADQGSLGIVFNTLQFVYYPWYEMPFRSAWHGTTQALQLSGMILEALKTVGSELARGSISEEVAGPVGIVYQAQKGQFFDQGILSVFSFAGILSINLAIMNMLPFPPLDGGRAVTSLFEIILGKQKSRLVEYYTSYGGYVLLIILIVVITFSDISRIVLGS